MSRYLLDTCSFLWLDGGRREQFGAAAMRILYQDVDLVLSDASVWEMCVKSAIGRLSLATGIADLIESHASRGLRLLPIERRHILLTESLPMHHRDPFDRLLAAQAIVESIPILSADAIFDQYGAGRVWA